MTLRRTADGRHTYEVHTERGKLEDMEEEFDILWQSGEMLDTDEENPRLKRLLEKYDDAERSIYPNMDDPFSRMDEEEDWDEEEERKERQAPPKDPKKRKAWEKAKREAKAEKSRDKLTIRQQIDQLEKDGLAKKEADKLREKWRGAIKAEERGLRLGGEEG